MNAYPILKNSSKTRTHPHLNLWLFVIALRERSSYALCYGIYLLSELDYKLLEVSYSLLYSLKCLAQCFPHITDSHWSQCIWPNQIMGERRNRSLGVWVQCLRH